MIRRLLALLRHDFWLKLLSLTVAVLLWAMVVQDYNKVTSVTFDVPLEVIAHPEYEIFEGRRDLETEVEVRVTGPNLLVSSLKADDLRAWVDYSTVQQAGRAQEVRVQVAGPPRYEGQVEYRANPATVTVTLVENRTLTVPVAVTPESGIVAVGDREFRYTAVPVNGTIFVSGRADYLGLVRSAVVALQGADLEPPLQDGRLTETRTRLQKAVRLVDAVMQPVEKLAEHYAEVEITWEELPPGKRVTVSPQTVGELPPGFELAGVSVSPAEVTIRSATLDGSLPQVSAVQTEPVDLSGQTQSFTTVARLVAPAGTSLAQTSVEVAVSIREVSAEKLFGAVPIAVQNAPEGLEVTLSQGTVEVRLTGRYTLVHPLDASAVIAYVDVAGLGPGTHRLPVKVIYPPEIVETAIDPAVIEVTISPAEIQ
ncbi:MAG: hypothetical protein A6D92_01040 [Symbiobacterium thermophilum]|uniref:YbbR-like domain-containing protein n=1 Tax=Symbiobacterium thermophilum TaxID=2734 RepID=A0A1Y2T8Y7_SYMTR|nr:MAG: hypothetical protein A6D92_01040 [Symbiobacterium thermophilum]